ncbi:MAG: hypothetical protein UT03_C0054G0001 [Candidatus Moranbacteria bacterium GW2011_GWD2_38_7]|nr:MAG: hypothetical protein US82_C0017G0005 [Parcubacteria group bacterium GW2011_GWC1_38_22]KKQ79438.1 MAG: hypothetical protein UT03_C0054G0001 [Candidatus Moranbacteria bacterium GW2011_GWD2_38_7]
MKNNDNNNNNGHDMKMMWLMMLPCLLLLIVFIAISGKGLSSVTNNWQWITPIAFMIGIHVLMMKFMHSNKESSCHEESKKDENKIQL